MNLKSTLFDLYIKPIFYIKSSYGLIHTIHEQLTYFRIYTNLYHHYTTIPKILYIEPTNHCNIKCICCPSERSNRKKGYMDYALFQKIIDEAKRVGVQRIHLYLHGEPLLHPNIIDMIAYIKANNLQLYFVTNGMLLTTEKCKAILQTGLNKNDVFVVSILGYSKELHEKIMKGVNHRIVIQNIRNFLELRKKQKFTEPFFKVVFGLTPENKREQELFLRYWSTIVDHAETELLSESFRHYKQNSIPNITRKHTCMMLWDRMMIFWNGDVTMCCADLNGEYLIGNLRNSSIIDTWNSPKFIAIKKIHERKKFQTIPLCSHCDMQ